MDVMSITFIKWHYCTFCNNGATSGNVVPRAAKQG
jgi:hypothetical protein